MSGSVRLVGARGAAATAARASSAARSASPRSGAAAAAAAAAAENVGLPRSAIPHRTPGFSNSVTQLPSLEPSARPWRTPEAHVTNEREMASQAVLQPQQQQTSIAQPHQTSTRRVRAPRKAALEITPNALARLAELLASQRKREPSKAADAVRLGLKKRGCNGLSYTLNYVQQSELSPMDEVVEHGEVKVVIDPQALLSVVGTKMDWEETRLKSEFVFTNPNATSLCGCKESFSV